MANKRQKSQILILTLVSMSTFVMAEKTQAQGVPGANTTLRTPYIPGATVTPEGMVAPLGQPPACGDGPIPAPVTPGMGGPPTLLPSVPFNPANDIDYPSYAVPWTNATESTPGSLGPALPSPPPPSTPGANPGMITHPLNFYPPPVSVVPINPGGGIYGAAPMTRWGGQTSRDFGRYKHRGTRKFDFGQQAVWGSNSADGPQQTRRGGKQERQDLYGQRQPDSGSMVQTIAPY